MGLSRVVARHGLVLLAVFAFSLVALNLADSYFVGGDKAWRSFFVEQGLDTYLELKSTLKLSSFLAASCALPLIILFGLMTTKNERVLFWCLAAVAHGSITAASASGGTARVSALKHVLASFLVLVVCEAVKLAKAGAQLRKWRADIKRIGKTKTKKRNYATFPLPSPSPPSHAPHSLLPTRPPRGPSWSWEGGKTRAYPICERGLWA